jgi:hypothetical protein
MIDKPSASIEVELLRATLNIAKSEIDYLRRREKLANDALKAALPDYNIGNEPMYNGVMRLAAQRNRAESDVEDLRIEIGRLTSNGTGIEGISTE